MTSDNYYNHINYTVHHHGNKLSRAKELKSLHTFTVSTPTKVSAFTITRFPRGSVSDMTEEMKPGLAAELISLTNEDTDGHMHIIICLCTYTYTDRIVCTCIYIYIYTIINTENHC